MMAAMVEGFISQAFCIAKARLETRLTPSAKSMAPAATNAENSPKEWPATISGANFSPRDFAKMTEWRNTAGWVTFVCFNSDSSPANMTSVIRKPSISLAFSNRSFAKGMFSYKSLPIPMNWAPCPGNTNAFIKKL